MDFTASVALSSVRKRKMPPEDLIQEILSHEIKISREEIGERLKRERSRTNGFISDETLLRMIAAELGVSLQNETNPLGTLSVADLIPSLNNVTVVGRVVAVFPPKTFNGRRSGRFASFLIADMSGTLRVVLWNDKASVVESGLIKAGKIVRVSRGYTKEGSGGVELHVGEKCKLEVDPQDANSVDFPTIKRFATSIESIIGRRQNSRVTVIGTVERVFEPSTFERQDSTVGKVMRVILSDESGQVSAVFWNEKVDEFESVLALNARLAIVWGKSRTSNDVVEIHVDSGSYVELVQEEDEFTKIEQLKDKQRRISVEGQVVTKPVTREVRTFKDEVVKVSSFELEDETGRIWVSAWRNHADAIKDLNVGAKIVLKNACVRRGFGDRPEISTQNATLIRLSEEEEK